MAYLPKFLKVNFSPRHFHSVLLSTCGDWCLPFKKSCKNTYTRDVWNEDLASGTSCSARQKANFRAFCSFVPFGISPAFLFAHNMFHICQNVIKAKIIQQKPLAREFQINLEVDVFLKMINYIMRSIADLHSIPPQAKIRIPHWLYANIIDLLQGLQYPYRDSSSQLENHNLLPSMVSCWSWKLQLRLRNTCGRNHRHLQTRCSLNCSTKIRMPSQPPMRNYNRWVTKGRGGQEQVLRNAGRPRMTNSSLQPSSRGWTCSSAQPTRFLLRLTRSCGLATYRSPSWPWKTWNAFGTSCGKLGMR